MCRKISASVDGGPSGGSRSRRPGARTPIGTSGNLTTAFSGLAGGDEAVEKCLKIKEEAEETDDYDYEYYDYADYYDCYDYLEDVERI